jgi:hypothetical protein
MLPELFETAEACAAMERYYVELTKVGILRSDILF